jgi:GNAT superfamily N-acetyltransferase
VQKTSLDAQTQVASSPRARPPKSLSQQLWSLDWSDHFPRQLAAGGIGFEVSNFARALPFIHEHFAQIFPDEADSPFRQLDGLDAKARYYELSDFFEYVHDGRTVGLVIGSPLDWSTYYCRTTAILPEYQSRGLGDLWFKPVFDALAAAGVQRIEGDVAPSNLPMLRMLTRNGFQVTGVTLTDRWGALNRMTLFLNDARAAIFKNQFCPSFGPRPSDIIKSH